MPILSFPENEKEAVSKRQPLFLASPNIKLILEIWYNKDTDGYHELALPPRPTFHHGRIVHYS